MKKAIFILVILIGGLCFGDINSPYTDSMRTIGLWHFDEIVNGLVLDDNSVAFGRSANLTAHNSPSIIDPLAEGIGYPADNPAFDKCIQLDGINQYLTVPNGNLNIDLADFKVEGWFKVAEHSDAIIFDRWGQMVIQIWEERFRMIIWDSEGAGYYSAWYSDFDIDPKQWNHFAVDVASDNINIYLNGNFTGSYSLTGGLSTDTNRSTTYIGRRYNGGNYFNGYIDEFRISGNLLIETLPDGWDAPYEDEAFTVKALWHFEQLAEPAVSGVDYELMPDDDSANPGRGADLMLYSDFTRIDVGESGGPVLVDPQDDGVGYPADNPAFGNAAYFGDPETVKANFRLFNSDINVQPENIKYEAWVRPADELIDLEDGQSFIIDRWGQAVIRLMWREAYNSWGFNAILWPSEGSTKYLSAQIPDYGIDPKSWIHVAAENYYGQLGLYINGILVNSTDLGAEALAEPLQQMLYIGCRYNRSEWFWGHIDEVRVSQAVYDVGCGDWGYLPGDVNKDCYVDIEDLKIISQSWLESSADAAGGYTPEGDAIINPYDGVDWQSFGQYKASLHNHTTESDGQHTVAELIDAYHTLGYSILSITDHDTMRTEQTTWPWTDFGRDPELLGMVAIEGNEISNPHHVGSYYNDYGDEDANITQALTEIGNRDGLAVMFHPGRYTSYTLNDYIDLYDSYSHLIGMEVYNQGDLYPNDRVLWDNVLTEFMPERAVWGFSNDDTHRPEHIGRNWNVFVLEQLNDANVRDAMESGVFYFCYSVEQNGSVPIINSIEVDNTDYTITIDASGYEEVVWISRGEQVQTGETFFLSEASIWVNDYVRARLIGPEGYTYTQPFGIINPNPCVEVYRQGLNDPADVSNDCFVGLKDLSIIAKNWLGCSVPGEQGCVDAR